MMYIKVAHHSVNNYVASAGSEFDDFSDPPEDVYRDGIAPRWEIWSEFVLNSTVATI